MDSGQILTHRRDISGGAAAAVIRCRLGRPAQWLPPHGPGVGHGVKKCDHEPPTGRVTDTARVSLVGQPERQ